MHTEMERERGNRATEESFERINGMASARYTDYTLTQGSDYCISMISLQRGHCSDRLLNNDEKNNGKNAVFNPSTSPQRTHLFVLVVILESRRSTTKMKGEENRGGKRDCVCAEEDHSPADVIILDDAVVVWDLD